MARFPAFLDTCSIFPAYLCDTLLRLAEAGTYRPLWSGGVLDELERNLVEERGLSSKAVSHRIGEMRRAFPDAEVSGYDTLIEAMECDPKDRHVLAAAVRGRADGFLLDQLDLYPGVTLAALRAQAESYTSPAMNIEDLLGRLAAAGVPRFASEARRHL